MPEQKKILSYLETHKQSYRRLCESLANMGPIKKGSIYKVNSRCGSPGCQCHRDPKARHGPYWLWTSKADGKSQCRKLDSLTLKLYRLRTVNYRKLKSTIKQMEQISDRILIYELKLADFAGCKGGRRMR